MRNKLFGSSGSLFFRLAAWTAIVAVCAACGSGRSAAGVEDMPGPLLELRVRFPPQKTEYYVGEPFTPEGLVVEGRYANSGIHEIPLDELFFSGFDSSVPAAGQAVTVAYRGLTTRFMVDIYPVDSLGGVVTF